VETLTRTFRSERQTLTTMTSPAELLRELELIRNGFNHEGREIGVRCVSAPVP
jgi:DNA-binding IclR family transcriptional regulator